MSNVKELQRAVDDTQAKLKALAAPVAGWQNEAAQIENELPALEAQRLDELTAGADAKAKRLATEIDQKRARLGDLRAMGARREAELQAQSLAWWTGPRQAWLDAMAAQAAADAMVLGNKAGELQRQTGGAVQAYAIAKARADTASAQASEATWANHITEGVAVEVRRLLGAPVAHAPEMGDQAATWTEEGFGQREAA